MHVLRGILCHYELITSLSALQRTMFLCKNSFLDSSIILHLRLMMMLMIICYFYASFFFCRYNLIIIQSESL